MELYAQMKLVAFCAATALLLDAMAVGIQLAALYYLRACTEDVCVCTSVSRYMAILALACIHHGSVFYVMLHRTQALMSTLLPSE